MAMPAHEETDQLANSDEADESELPTERDDIAHQDAPQNYRSGPTHTHDVPLPGNPKGSLYDDGMVQPTPPPSKSRHALLLAVAVIVVVAIAALVWLLR